MRRSLLLLTAFGAGSLVPAHAWADDDGTVSDEVIRADIRSYYGGEARASYIVMGLSAASAGAGAVLVTRNSDFARGLGWPWLAMGALEGVGAVFYALKVGSQLDHYEGLFNSDRRGFQLEEDAHIHGTTSRFVIYRAIELSLTVAGAVVATYGFIANKDLYKGIGLGVATEAAPFFVIDTFNQARAARYQDHLDRFQPAVTLLLDGHACGIAVGGRF